MMISSSTFIIPSYIYYIFNDYIGYLLFTIVTITSILSDGYYKNHLIYNKIDKFVATTCYIYAGISILIPSYYISIKIFILQNIIFPIPLLFIIKSRKCETYSDKWRKWHMSWHYCASILLSLSLINVNIFKSF
jgi:hypothetical protein